VIVVWFSCGVASAVAAKVTLEKYPHETVRIVNIPVAEEDEDNLRFKDDVARWLGVPIETFVHSKWPKSSAVEIWEHGRFMSNRFGAECTRTLKKGARYQWQDINKPDNHVLGFTADEKARAERFKKTECDTHLPVLVDAGITKADCFEIVRQAGIQRPRIYDMGYPNANCIGCVKATSPTYWNLVREKHPEIFEQRAKLSREIGCKLVRVKNNRIFLDELKPTDKGRKIKSWDCGVFCEESPTPEGEHES
jgi:hypothetical protein